MAKFINKKLSASSKQWITRSKRNLYTNKARIDNVPSRSYYKLEEINNKYRIFKKDQFTLDLGCCPGGWSLYIKNIGGTVHGCDLLNNMKTSIDKFILGDFTDKNNWSHFIDYNNIVSDMAVNSTGNRWLDNYKNHELATEVWHFTENHLLKKGNFVIKLFESEYTNEYIKNIKHRFERVIKFIPNATHKTSSEFYLVALKFIS